MKSETLNGVLTFILGVLIVAGVVLALRLVNLSRSTRTLENQELKAQALMVRAQDLFADAQAYDQKEPSPELTRILQSVQTKAPNH
jgi:hypothetical protein